MQFHTQSYNQLLVSKKNLETFNLNPSHHLTLDNNNKHIWLMKLNSI